MVRYFLGVCFGAGISWFNFFLLRKWAVRLGNFQNPTLLFFIALFCRYLVLFFGVFIIVSDRWFDRWAGLFGLFGMYVGLLVYEFVRLRRTGE